MLAERPIDVALLCVGSYQMVADEPTAFLHAMQPRYAIGGHWEDFFVSADGPSRPQPLLDTARWLERAKAELPGAGQLQVDGSVGTGRAFLPEPGTTFVLEH